MLIWPQDPSSCEDEPALSRRYIRSERSVILINFCLSIISSNALILIGQTQTRNKVYGLCPPMHGPGHPGGTGWGDDPKRIPGKLRAGSAGATWSSRSPAGQGTGPWCLQSPAGLAQAVSPCLPCHVALGETCPPWVSSSPPAEQTGSYEQVPCLPMAEEGGAGGPLSLAEGATQPLGAQGAWVLNRPARGSGPGEPSVASCGGTSRPEPRVPWAWRLPAAAGPSLGAGVGMGERAPAP